MSGAGVGQRASSDEPRLVRGALGRPDTLLASTAPELGVLENDPHRDVTEVTLAKF